MKLVLTVLFISAISCVYAQMSISPAQPCSNELISITFPTTAGGCTPAVSSITIIPVPDIAGSNPPDYYRPIYLASLGGYIGFELRYGTNPASFHVEAPYACTTGTGNGNFAATFPLIQGLTANPSISGMDGYIYQGDSRSATAAVVNAPSQTTYSWQISNVNATIGSINSSAIASPQSATTLVNIPSTFVGEFDLVSTASVCNDSQQTAKHISILYAPDIHIVKISSTPDYESENLYCAGSVVQYGTAGFSEYPGSHFITTLTTTQLSAGGALLEATPQSPDIARNWKIRWDGDGILTVTYQVKERNGTNPRVWNIQSQINYNVSEFSPGTIGVPTLPSYCGPVNIPVNAFTTPTGAGGYSFQYCNTGNCGSTSIDWINNSPATSPTFFAVAKGASFRIKMNETRCGVFTSNVVAVPVIAKPQISVSDQKMFSGGTFQIPTADQELATLEVTFTENNGVQGVSNVTGISGSFPPQTVSSDLASGATVKFSIKPTGTAGCVGDTKQGIITVYATPVISSNPKGVYKGGSVTLSTQGYDGYQWKTEANENRVTTPTYQVTIPGGYKVLVTKAGLQAESPVFQVGGQFDGVNENYILVRSPLVELSSANGIGDSTENEVTENIQYFDGIGRSIQTIGVRASPGAHHDIVQPVEYDVYGREARKYLPYVSTQDNGRIQLNAVATDQATFYQQNVNGLVSDTKPYAEIVFEGSPLNRVVEQGAPGAAWQPGTGHTVKKQHLTNNENETLLFTYHSETGLSDDVEYYQANTLQCIKTIDEEGSDILEYIDKQGRIICKKVKAFEDIYATTYYVYDNFGNLVIVIPPEGTQDILNQIGN